MAILLEEMQIDEDTHSQEEIDLDEINRILKRIGQKCPNREHVETLLSLDPLYVLPGLLKGYCRFCIGYKDLGECKGIGYGRDEMKTSERIREVEISSRACY